MADLSQAREAFRVRISDALLKVVQAVGKNTLVKVQGKTPVESGRARAGWTINKNIPSADIPLPNLPSYTFLSPVMIDANPFGQLFVANNLDYILDLEFGGSPQAPVGMARTTVEEIKNEARLIVQSVL